MKIGFIGAGNMAGAIIGGVIASGLIPPCDIYAYDILGEKLNSLAELRCGCFGGKAQCFSGAFAEAR